MGEKNKSFDQMTLNEKKELINFEQDLMRQEQIELSNLMPLPPKMNDLWFNTIAQIGYISFFSLVFPIGPLWGLVINIIHVHLFFFLMGRSIKRPLAIEKSSIGIWEQIMYIYSMLALIINAGVVAFSCKGIYKLAGLDPDLSENIYKILVIMILIENGVFVIKFLIAELIPDIPDWVVRRLKERACRKRFIQETHVSLHLKYKDIELVRRTSTNYEKDNAKITKNIPNCVCSRCILC